MRTRRTRPAPLAPHPRSLERPLSRPARVREIRRPVTRETGGMRSVHRLICGAPLGAAAVEAIVPAGSPALAAVKHAPLDCWRAEYVGDEEVFGPLSTSGRLYGSPGNAAAVQPLLGSTATDAKSARLRLPWPGGTRPQKMPCVQMSP